MLKVFYMALGDNYLRIAESLSDLHLTTCIELWRQAIMAVRSVRLAEETESYGNERPVVINGVTDFHTVTTARQYVNKSLIATWIYASCINYAESMEFLLACMRHYKLRFGKAHRAWANTIQISIDVPGWNQTDVLTDYPLPPEAHRQNITPQEYWTGNVRRLSNGHRWTPPGNPEILMS